MPTKKEKQPLSVTHPELAKEADGWDPSTVSKGMKIRKDWLCTKGHQWTVAITDRVAGNGCPFCSGNRVIVGENDFETLFPELLQYVDGWDPKLVKGQSNQRVNWKCSLGHKWKVRINSVTSGRDGLRTPCPFCLNQKVLAGFNDLSTTHPRLAKEAHGWNPSTEIAGSSHKKEWKCEEGHTWTSAIYSRSGKMQTGCPFCSNQKVWKGFNDLATINPDLAKQANGWNPSEVTTRANIKLSWICDFGHQWDALLSNRGKGVGCPVCANQQVLVGFNDLSSKAPVIAEQAYGWDPSSVVFGSSKKLKWICSLGHIYSASPYRRISGDGCPFCSSHQLLQGFNDLLTNFPAIANEAHGWDPSTLMSQSNKTRKWCCAEGHIWKTSPATRVAGIGCPSCAKTGYDPNKDGFLYFLHHLEWEMLQIGITNVPDIRLAKHKKRGWVILELRGPMDGHLTQQWETAILRMLKAKGADLSNAKVAGKFDGYSEAWSKSTFDAKSIKDLMRLTEDWEARG